MWLPTFRPADTLPFSSLVRTERKHWSLWSNIKRPDELWKQHSFGSRPAYLIQVFPSTETLKFSCTNKGTSLNQRSSLKLHRDTCTCGEPGLSTSNPPEVYTQRTSPLSHQFNTQAHSHRDSAERLNMTFSSCLQSVLSQPFKHLNLLVSTCVAVSHFCSLSQPWKIFRLKRMSQSSKHLFKNTGDYLIQEGVRDPEPWLPPISSVLMG